jgi:hypothetical protein
LRRRPAILLACAAGIMAVQLAAAAPAPASTADWLSLSRQIASVWPPLQNGSGHFADYVVRRAPGRSLRDDYGDAMLGYGLLQAGIRDGDRAQIDAGLAAETRAARDKHPKRAVAMFRYMALASAYNLARVELAADPAFAQVRPTWEKRLTRLRVLRLGPDSEVTNKSLVEAVEILELARSGLRSNVHGAILEDPAAAVRLVRDLLASQLPHAARPFQHGSRGGRLALIGDFTGLPLAYHSLALGFLARAVDLLGPHAPAAARTLLGRAAAASWALAGPDGDLAYMGRSQEQSWTLALTAYGAEIAAGGGSPAARRYDALAERAVARLGAAYRIDRQGLRITPALSQDPVAGLRGLDYYVAAATYNGLTLVGLDWALEAAARRSQVPGATGADTEGSFVLGARGRQLATVRRGDVWFAVKQRHLPDTDLRYDFGLIAMQVRDGAGAWRDVLPLRPRVEGRIDAAGPALIVGGRAARPDGTRLVAGHGGTVSVSTRFSTSSGRVVRRGVPVTFRPVACGVEMTLPVQAGDSYQYSAFFARGSSPVERTDTAVADQTQRVSFSQQATVTLERGYSSGSTADLVRARIRFEDTPEGQLSVTTCLRRAIR